ncbi:single-stranded DNA-binding protein [bacterium]|nr:MAG: single-stranded DNA-binding protein [bacterium]
MDLNRAQVVGRLTRDPESRTTPNGQTVTSFSVATSFAWKDQSGNPKEITEFHNVVAWRKLAEIVAQYLHKGSRVLIEGRLQTRSWEGQDGVKRYRTEIVADNMIMLDSKGSSTAQGARAAAAPTPEPQEEVIQQEEPAAQTPQPKSQTGDEEISVEDIPF